jgi:hypothetical protein
MAQKYYNSAETAAILGIGVDEVKAMLDRRDLHGYRDGADWKFKVEDIDQMAKDRVAQQPAAHAEEAGGDVLLSEVTLGQSDVGTSGTVIAMNGMSGSAMHESDIHLAGSSIDLQESDRTKTPLPIKKDASDSKTAQFEELNLTLDEDLTLEDSTVTLSGKPVPGGSGSSGSVVDLSGKDLEDDDLVLGGSGKGSDVTIGGDSGISLVDPTDSGLSLEEPLKLASSSDDSLQLGEDDVLQKGPSATTRAAAPVTGDSDFLLTPLEEGGEGDESASGSQVIALDTGGGDSGLLGDSTTGAMAAMLEEDLGGQPLPELGSVAGLGVVPVLAAQPGALPEGAVLMQPASLLPEAPYSAWQITGLVICAILLMLCGMMMFDLLRNMWSWEGAYTVNSSLMDMVLSLFEKK